MSFNSDLAYSESTWQNDSYSREREMNYREERDLQDWQEADLTEEQQARRDANFARVAIARCDGDGIAEEHFFDVDQTRVIPCPGCPACMAQVETVRLGDDRPEPEWMRDPELVEFGVTRKPAAAEVWTPGTEHRRVA